MGKSGFWVLIFLLVILVEPLRDSLWSVLLYADPLVLVAALFVVWYLARNG